MSAQSDYEFHGFSITNRRPALIANLVYDHASGFYLGGSAIAEDAARDGPEFLGSIQYAGYARHDDAGRSWDLGVSNADLSSYIPGQKTAFHYTELYGGVSTEHASLYVRYSPNYIRPGASALYLDLSGAVRPADRWRLFAHAGLTVPLTWPAGGNSPKDHYDLRAGVARQLGAWELQLAATTAGPTGPPAYPAKDRGAVILGLAYSF